MYEKLSSALTKEGVIKSGEQCRTKVKKLRQDYKKIKDNHNQTGRGRTSWKFFEPLNDILGTRPATRPPVVLDTQDATSLVAEENDEISDEEEDVVESGSSAVTNEDSMSMENSKVEVTGTKSGSSSRSTTPARSSTAIKGKKRKRSKGEVMEEVLSNVMKTITEGLKESDRMFLELEEKRMKFEEQQKKEERQFQLQMMQLLVGSSQQPHMPADPHSQFFPRFPPYGNPYYNPRGDTEDP